MVSIHAPTQGATQTHRACKDRHGCFNSRTHTGCDPIIKPYSSKVRLFQFTHPHRVRRPRVWLPAAHPRRFNSRTHTGCDYVIRIKLTTIDSFNSRTHTGCDTSSAPKPRIVKVSIHAPTQGATVSVESFLPSHEVSIHAPTQGATLPVRVGLICIIVSIHAPTQGATLRALVAV